jgi:cytochrome c553
MLKRVKDLDDQQMADLAVWFASLAAGQYPEYLVYTLTEFKEGDRTNDVYSRMRYVAEALTEEEIEALAGYYAAAVPEEEDEDEE